MKLSRVVFMSLAIVVAMGAEARAPQFSKSDGKQLKEFNKQVQNANKVKLSSATKKEIKDKQKEGWKPFPGTQSMELQFAARDRYEASIAINDDYYVGTAMVSSNKFNAASRQALRNARLNLAEKLTNEFTELIKDNLANENEEVSYSNFKATSQELISKRLPDVTAAVQIMREADGLVYCSVTVYADKAQAEEFARKQIEQQLKLESKDMEKELKEHLNKQ